MDGSSCCFVCKVNVTKQNSYTNVPCQCNIYCKSCAMKMATGGKCKKCCNYFTHMKNISINEDDIKHSKEDDK